MSGLAQPLGTDAMDAPLGIVLAGGRGRRIGGDKATVSLDGEPLLVHALRGLAAVARPVVIVAKRDTALPPLAEVADVWIEPDDPQHPLAGVVHALRQSGGRPVLAIAVDLPLLDEATLRQLCATDPDGAVAVVASADGRLQPLCALYLPPALAALDGFDPARPATELVREAGIREMPVADPAVLTNVNAPEDLLCVSAMRAERRIPAAKKP